MEEMKNEGFEEIFIRENPMVPMVEIVEKVNCPSCGAPLKIKAGEIVVTCEYCGTAVNLKAERSFVLRHSIIPNKYSKEEIEKLVRSWMRSGFAMPENVARKARFEQVRLVHLPFYVVTAHAVTKYQGMFTRTGKPRDVQDTIAKDYQWTVLGRRVSQFPEREYRIPLSGKASFDLSLVQGEFLNAELDEGDAEEKGRAEIEFHQNYLAKEKADHITESTTTIDVKGCEFLHAPVWFIDYEYNGKVYHVLMDGATGEVIMGDIPVEESKFPWVWILAILVVFFVLLVIVL